MDIEEHIPQILAVFTLYEVLHAFHTLPHANAVQLVVTTACITAVVKICHGSIS